MSGAARLAAAAWSTIFWSQSFGWSLCHTFKRFKQALSFIIINVYQSKSTHRVCRSIIVYSNNWCHLLGGTGESICTEVGELQVDGGWTFFNSPYSCIVRPIIRDDTPLFQIIQRSTWLLRVVNDVKGATQVRSRPHGRCANPLFFYNFFFGRSLIPGKFGSWCSSRGCRLERMSAAADEALQGRPRPLWCWSQAKIIALANTAPFLKFVVSIFWKFCAIKPEVKLP